MDRRDFLRLNLREKPSTLTPGYEPTGITLLDGPLTRKQAVHLLRRFTFAPTTELIDELTGLDVAQAVVRLLGDQTGSQAEPSDLLKGWIDEQEEDPLSVGSQVIRGEIEGRLRTRYRQFKDWWLATMRDEDKPFYEKNVLFWSTVWCIEFPYDTNALIPPPLIYRNNQTIRKNCYGNYKNFALDITLDGAMLLYQSMYYSTNVAPNENYQRELLELFTMGTNNLSNGDPNYTETDIQEGTRALTGWKTAAYKFQNQPNGPFNTYFEAPKHDTDSKTFMKEIIPSRDPVLDNTEEKVRDEEILGGILKIMFDNRAEAISFFVCSKLYRFYMFASEADIDWTFVAELAQVLRNNDFNLKPVFEELFKSDRFYNEEYIGAQIKTPVEYIVGLERMLGVEYAKSRIAVDDLEMMLYDPPNVGSWKAYRTWISTNTYPLRVKYGHEIADLPSEAMLISLAKKLPGFENADTMTDSLIEYFLPRAVSQERHDRYKAILLQNAGVDEAGWTGLINNNETEAGVGIRALIKEFILSPDFELN